MPLVTSTPLRIAIVAASPRIVGGHSVQAQHMLDRWRTGGEVVARLVPIDPLPPRWCRACLAVWGLRTLVTQLVYWPLLLREVPRADVVHVFSASYTAFLLATLPAVLVGLMLGTPVVLNYHSGEAADHLRRSRLARRILRRRDVAVVVPSVYLRDVLASFGIAAAVVPNAVDLTRFAYRARTSFAPRLLSTRNLEPLYNVRCTLQAFALVQARWPDASLVVVGDGSQAAALRAEAQRLQVRHVSFAGRVAPTQIQAYYAAADIYIQSPVIDNAPISVLEAFSAGLAVVSTAVGGVPVLVRDGVDGLLVADNDAAGLADAVLAVLDDQEATRRRTAAARQRCDEFDWSAVRDAWIDVYQRAARGHAAVAAVEAA